MKINNAYTNAAQTSAQATKKTAEANAQAKVAQKESSESKKADPNSFKATESEISSKGKDFAKAFAIATETPEIREDRVAELRKKIQSGEYKVNADAIAERLLSEHSA